MPSNLLTYKMVCPFYGWNQFRNKDEWDLEHGADRNRAAFLHLFSHIAAVPWHSQYGSSRGAFRFKRQDLKIRKNVLYYRLRIKNGESPVCNAWAPLVSFDRFETVAAETCRSCGQPRKPEAEDMVLSYSYPSTHPNGDTNYSLKGGEDAACLERIEQRLRKALSPYERGGEVAKDPVIKPALFPHSVSDSVRLPEPARNIDWDTFDGINHVPLAQISAFMPLVRHKNGEWRLRKARK